MSDVVHQRFTGAGVLGRLHTFRTGVDAQSTFCTVHAVFGARFVGGRRMDDDRLRSISVSTKHGRLTRDTSHFYATVLNPTRRKRK